MRSEVALWTVLSRAETVALAALLLSCDHAPCSVPPPGDDTQATDWADSETNSFPPMDSCLGGLLDPATGLCWRDPPSEEEHEWAEAITHCQDLETGEGGDWRLPSISELRSLVRGCAGAGAGGLCNVSDDCLETWCWNEACSGCPMLSGPGEGGCYWDASHTGECTWHWSASPVLVGGGDPSAWYVRFRDGAVNHTYVTRAVRIRCVRDGR